MSQRIYPNIKIAGVDVGLLTQTQAFDKVARELSERGARKLDFQLNSASLSGQQNFEIDLASQETAAPVEEAVSEAFDFGRRKFYFPTAEVSLNIKPSAAIKRQVQNIASNINEPPIDSNLKVLEGEITVTPSQKGTILDEQDLYSKISNYFNTGILSNPQISLNTSDPKLNFSEASAIKRRLDEIKQKPIKLKFEDLSYTLDINTILSLVDLENSQDSLALIKVDDSKFNLSSISVNGGETSDSKLTLNNGKLAEYLKNNSS